MARPLRSNLYVSTRLAWRAVLRCVLAVIFGWSGALAFQPAPTQPQTKQSSQMAFAQVDIVASPNPTTVEGNPLIFIVQLKAAVFRDIIIGFSVSDADNVVQPGQPTSITIPAGQTQGSIAIATIGDTVVNADRIVLVTLTSASGRGSIGSAQARGIVRNDDKPAPPPFAEISSSPRPEAVEGQSLSFAVRLRRPNSSPVVISYRVEGNPAPLSPSRPPSITIPAGQIRGFISIPTVDDELVNGDRMVAVRLIQISGDGSIGNAQAEGTIRDNDVLPDPPVFAISSGGDVTEGEAVRMTVSVDRPSTDARRVGLNVSADNGTLIDPVPTSAFLRAGDTQTTITFQTAGDEIKTKDRKISVTLIASDAVTIDPQRASATALIRDNDPDPVPDPAVDEGGQPLPEPPTPETPNSDSNLPMIAVIVAIVAAGLWAASRFIVPRFYRVLWGMGSTAAITATHTGTATVLPPGGGIDIDIGEAIAIRIGDCAIVSEEERDEPDDRD